MTPIQTLGRSYCVTVADSFEATRQFWTRRGAVRYHTKIRELCPRLDVSLFKWYEDGWQSINTKGERT